MVSRHGRLALLNSSTYLDTDLPAYTDSISVTLNTLHLGGHIGHNRTILAHMYRSQNPSSVEH